MSALKSGTKRFPRPYVMAMLLGTALTTLGPAPAQASSSPDATLSAVQSLSRYCTTCWKNARLPQDLWTDCTQEVLSRLLQRVEVDSWGRLLREDTEDRREFLRAIDAVKKRTQRARRWVPEPAEGIADTSDQGRQRLREDREAISQAAEELLNPRQQRIMQLSFEGWSVHEIAEELQTTPERVSDEKYKAIRKLRGHFLKT